MYNNPYFIPGYIGPNLVRGVGTNTLFNGARNVATNGLLNGTSRTLANSLANTTRGAGLLSRLGTGLSGIKSINWGGLINNTSKTLGIINQTIPLVRQVGPMVNNMRSMLKVASLFKDETDTPSKPNYKTKTNNQKINTNTPTNNHKEKISTNNYTEQNYNEAPTFFVAT